MTRPWIEPRFPGPLANTLLTRSMNQAFGSPSTTVANLLDIDMMYIYIYIYIHIYYIYINIKCI